MGRRGSCSPMLTLSYSVKVLACPLLILHAEDDTVLPPRLGRQVGHLLWGLKGREGDWDPTGVLCH